MEQNQEDNRTTTPNQHARLVGYPKRVWRWWRRIRRPFRLAAKVVGLILLMLTVWQGKDFIDNKREAWRQSAREDRRVRILVPLYATKKEFLKFDDLEEKKSLKLEKDFFSKKVSRDVITAIEGASQGWFSMRRGTNDGLSEKQVDFYFFPEGYSEDPKSYEAAFKKALREARHDRYQVAAVLGNITSTATVEYGKLCGRKSLEIKKEGDNKDEQPDESQIPMVLALSTAANVPQILRGNNVPAVLRLPPDNNEQAKLLAEFLLRDLPQPVVRTLVVRDLSNRTYSNDLIDSFRDYYVQSPLKAAQEVAAIIPKEKQSQVGRMMVWGNILAVVPAGGEQGGPPILAMLPQLLPEAVLVCGMTDVSLETLAQLEASTTKPAYVFLTDGAVDEYLLPQIATLISQNSGLRVYLSFPLETANPPSVEQSLKSTQEKDKKNLEMTHAMYVIDSVHIILTLLEDGIFKHRHEGTARQLLATEMKSLYENGPKEIGIPVPSGVSYTFDPYGNSTNLRYHLFRMCLPSMSGCPEDKPIAWIREGNGVPSPLTE